LLLLVPRNDVVEIDAEAGGRIVPLRYQRAEGFHNNVHAQRHAEQEEDAILAQMFRRASHHAL